MRTLCFLLCLFICSWCNAQKYQFKQYTIEDGLPTEIIKSIVQDSAGYFWAATDEGLVKFDGIQFTAYRNALRSQYAKGFSVTSNDRLLLYGDLDLVEIENKIDTVTFKSIRKGERNPTDSALWYPKTVFEDKHHDLWISEPQSVVRLHNDQLQRFDFEAKDRSPQFLRSFDFFEDTKGNLFTTSIQGSVFRYSDAANKFETYSQKFPDQVWHVFTAGHQVYIGAIEGVFIAELLEEGGFAKPQLKYPIKNVSCIKLLPDGRLFVGTTQDQHYFIHPETGEMERLPLMIYNVNHAFISGENDLWLSTNEGIFIVQENPFKNASVITDFIETIAEDTEQSEIYYANIQNLYKVKLINNKPLKTELIQTIPDGYYQDVEIAHGGVWVANGFSALFLQDGKIKKEFNFENEGRFVSDLFHDSEDQIWISQHNQQHTIVINRSFQLKRIFIPIEPGNNINVIREGPGGMYAASSGTNAYLFFKSKTDSAFKNISLPVNIKITGDFNVTDLVFSQGKIWMATTEGVMRYDGATVTQVNLGESFTGLPAKTIETYIDSSLLFATAKGLIRYDAATQDYWLYDESTGLNSNTITTRGLFVDHSKRIWIGTSRGLCYAEKSLIRNQQTLKPRIISFQVNGIPVRFTKQKPIPYGSFISITVSSISFPENKVIIQYKMDEDESWHVINNATISLSELPSGKHKIEMRAKKVGGLDWSGINHFEFEIKPAFWQQTWFLLVCFLGILVVVWLSIALANIRNARRRLQLQQLIDERTRELKISNDELSQRNSELDRFVYSASHDLSAPLKSILGLITIARMDNPSNQTEQYLTMMENSVRKLESFIYDVVNYSRNARLPVKHEPIQFKPFIESIWADYQYTPASKKIRFEVIDELKEVLRSDDVRLKIIFNNLISNAIKFHVTELRTDPFLRITGRDTSNHYEFFIEDNGQGISSELKDKVFDMFFRATQNAPGSGLGLYILKETIGKLGGTVFVESELGHGTKFTIRLPKSIQIS